MLPFLENKKVWAFPYLKIHEYGGFTKFPFHVFDRYEIHIQAFGDIVYGNLSFVNPHLREIILKMIYSK